MTATIKDVAKKAGVSITTVSRVLSNKMHVAPGTYQRIISAVEELNYVPNPAAVSLVRRSGMSVICADSYYKGHAYENPHMFDIISGITGALQKKDYSVTLLNLDRKKEAAEQQLINAIAARASDGIIVSGYYVTPRVEQIIIKNDFPHICIGEPDFSSILSWVDTNHALSSNLAIRHLLNSGCRRIAFLGGPKGDNIYKERLRGYLNSLKQNNLEHNPDWIACTSSNTQDIAEEVQRLLTLPSPPDSILCFNGLFAVCAVQTIEHAGLKIPKDISVMAFDNYPYAPLVIPPLSVVDIDMFSLGQRVGNSILKKIENPELYIQTYTALPRLILRDSTVHE